MIERLLAADAALERGELDLAQRMFGQVTDADSRNAIAVVGLARVAARRGERDEARELARRALQIDADEAAARRLLEELTAPEAPPVGPPLAAASPAAAQPPPPAAAAPTRRTGWRGWLDRILRRG